MYIELSPTASDAATVTISQILVTTAPVAATAQRIWDVQTSQIPCYADYRYLLQSEHKEYLLNPYSSLSILIDDYLHFYLQNIERQMAAIAI